MGALGLHCEQTEPGLRGPQQQVGEEAQMSAQGKKPLLPGHWTSLSCFGDEAAT